METQRHARLDRALLSLEGLSVGDAFGECFFAIREDALWLTASGLGDIDTTCAMVGGMVAAHTGLAGIPRAWRNAREVLPAWFHPGRREWNAECLNRNHLMVDAEELRELARRYVAGRKGPDCVPSSGVKSTV